MTGSESPSQALRDLTLAAEAASRDWDQQQRERSVLPSLDTETLRRRLARYDFAAPCSLLDVAADVTDLLTLGTVHVSHPRYFGLFMPPTRAAGVLGDAIAALVNPQVGAYWHAPAGNEVERHVLAYFARALQMPGDAAGGAAMFTSGGSEANATAVLAALSERFAAFADDGVAALPRAPVFYASEEAHDSLLKISHMTGLGRRALRRVRTDASRRLEVDDLRAQVHRDRQDGLAPFLVVGTAGTTGSGAIDPLGELASFCAIEDLWFHVDAAWGGMARLSPRSSALLAGIERADSVTWDAHKALPVPMGAGMIFLRRARGAEVAFDVHSAYVAESGADEPDLYRRSLQWSRRFIGLKVFLTLAELGEAGVAAMVDHEVAMGALLRERLQSEGWTLTNDSPLPLVCFTDQGLARDPVSTGALLHRLLGTGEVWISELRGRTGSELRACITHPETGPEDVEILVQALARARRGPV